MNIDVDTQSVMQALARLKDIPVAKVVRNASRDYVQGAYKATPIAKTSRSEFYVAIRNGRRWYIHESQMQGRKSSSNGETMIRKVRIKKGWSKSTWIGAFRALGMSPKVPAQRLHNEVEHRSSAIQRTGNEPSTTITDEFRIDDFGRGNTQAQHDRIAAEGFRLASVRMTKEYTKMLKEAWR